MKVLFVAPADPYAADGGANLRVRAFLQAVATRYETHVLCHGAASGTSSPGPGPLASLETVRFRPPRRLKLLWRMLVLGLPDLALRSHSVRMAIALHRRLARDDLGAVHLAGLQMACLQETFWSSVGDVPGQGRPPAKRPALILDELNAEYLVLRRLINAGAFAKEPLAAAAASIRSNLLRRFESRALNAADVVLCPSPQDRIDLAAIAPAGRIDVVPSGVETARYKDLPPPGDAPAAVFVGNFEYRPNRQGAAWLLERIAPLVWNRLPEAQFVLVGAGARCAVGARDRARVRCTGYVDDVRPHLAPSKAVLAPLLAGGGMKLKVLEGMAAGRPVVATSAGAEGIEAEPGREILVADGVDAYAEALVSVLADTSRARELGEAGKVLVTRQYDSAVVGQRYLEVLEAVLGGHAA